MVQDVVQGGNGLPPLSSLQHVCGITVGHLLLAGSFSALRRFWRKNHNTPATIPAITAIITTSQNAHNGIPRFELRAPELMAGVYSAHIQTQRQTWATLQG